MVNSYTGGIGETSRWRQYWEEETGSRQPITQKAGHLGGDI